MNHALYHSCSFYSFFFFKLCQNDRGVNNIETLTIVENFTVSRLVLMTSTESLMPNLNDPVKELMKLCDEFNNFTNDEFGLLLSKCKQFLQNSANFEVRVI